MSTPPEVYAEWTHPDVADDFLYALGIGDYATQPEVRGVDPTDEPVKDWDPASIDAVDAWYVEYHDGGRWLPGMSTGSELTLIALCRLKDGTYATVSAWNDYTGWGCQDGSVIRLASTRAEAITKGLTDRERDLLALTR